MPGKKFGFATSSLLKRALQQPLEDWKRRHGDYNELADRCGVSPAYLSHVRRYGRVPARSVLTLLAFNLDLDGANLFNLAGIKEPFPYESDLKLSRATEASKGLFSLSFNMEALSDTIREVVRSEVRQRSVKDLLSEGPLRIGMNDHMSWLFEGESSSEHRGVFPEFCQMLGMTLQKDIQLTRTRYSNYIGMLANSQLDLFGPTMAIPNLPEHILYSIPIFKLGVSALVRKRKTTGLDLLPVPESIEELRNTDYKIAVLKKSLPHLIVNTLLKRPDETLILCSSDEEGIDRITLKGVNSPAHLFVTNSMTALLGHKKMQKETALAFHKKGTLLDLSDVCIAVRPDWPEALPVINDAVRFLQARGGLYRRLKNVHRGELAEVVAYPEIAGA